MPHVSRVFRLSLYPSCVTRPTFTLLDIILPSGVEPWKLQCHSRISMSCRRMCVCMLVTCLSTLTYATRKLEKYMNVSSHSIGVLWKRDSSLIELLTLPTYTLYIYLYNLIIRFASSECDDTYVYMYTM